MTRVLSALRVQEGYRQTRTLISSFMVKSDVVGMIVVPAGFTCDYESVPLLRGTSKRAGVIHDYLYRRYSIPDVSREKADLAYLDMMKALRVSRFRRYAKYYAVRAFGASSYRKKDVLEDL